MSADKFGGRWDWKWVKAYLDGKPTPSAYCCMAMFDLTDDGYMDWDTPPAIVVCGDLGEKRITIDYCPFCGTAVKKDNANS